MSAKTCFWKVRSDSDLEFAQTRFEKSSRSLSAQRFENEEQELATNSSFDLCSLELVQALVTIVHSGSALAGLHRR